MGIFTFLISALMGAGVMYFLDPNMGDRRRALFRDQMVKMRNDAMEKSEDLSEEVQNRMQGAAAEASNMMEKEPVSDKTLVDRVRAEMGRYVSHPGAVEVTAYNGVVTLSGNILADELDAFMAKLKTMVGVERVNNQLSVHEEAGNIPDLQGGKHRPDMR